MHGPGKSLRVPARNGLMDDLLLEALQHLHSTGQQEVQVVNIGCGMDSKPWRLRLPLKVSWSDVDQPGVIQLKQQLLKEAGAEVTSTAGCGPAAHTFPLLVDSWRPVAADLSEVSLAACLEGSPGFDRSRPTVWLAEALLYYLPLDQAHKLLADMWALSGPGSRLITTCIDRELYIADHERMDQGHYFHAMWHFSVDELLQQGQLPQATGWRVDMQPCTTAELARQRYQRDTYVAAYGGAECVFTGCSA